MATRRPVIAGNWKMNLGGRQGAAQIQQPLAGLEGAEPDAPQLIVLAPFTALHVFQQLTETSNALLRYGAQDISAYDSGAYTGEISGPMLTEFGVSHVLAGHSERRARQHETDQLINAKLRAALRHGIIPILCVGEGLQIRRAGNHVEHTLNQIDEALSGIPAAQVAGMLIAYEPVWAIGTGEIATPQDVEEVCTAIRARLAELYDRDTADHVSILYGGSVQPDTSRAILDRPGIDGALIGGASLKAEQLLAIWRAAAA